MFHHLRFRGSLHALLLVLASSVLCIPNAFAASGDIFPDVPATHVHAQAIGALKSMNVISGNPEGMFLPDLYINRAEALKIIMESTITDIPTDKFQGFPDVDRSAWYAKYVALAKDKNIISGYPDGTFRGAELVNFAEVIKMSARTYGIVADTSYSKSQLKAAFPQYKGTEWFLPYMMYLKEKNLLVVSEPGAFPTRAELVELIYRLRMVQEFNLPEFNTQKADIYLAIYLSKKTATSSLANTTNSASSSALLTGKAPELTTPFFLNLNVVQDREHVLELVGKLLLECDYLQTYLMQKGIADNKALEAVQNQLLATKNEILSAKTQVVNAGSTLSAEASMAILMNMTTQRKSLVRLYAQSDIALLKLETANAKLLPYFTTMMGRVEYTQMVADYDNITQALDMAQRNADGISISTDEYVAYAETERSLRAIAPKVQEIYTLAYSLVK